MEDLQRNRGTVTTREESEYSRGDRRPRPLQLNHSSSLSRKRPASPVSLADVDSHSRRGSFKRRVLRPDYFPTATLDEFLHTPTVHSDTQNGPLSRGSTPSSPPEDRGVPPYASSHMPGLEDFIIEDTFPNVDATNEDGMLSPDHAMSLPSPTL